MAISRTITKLTILLVLAVLVRVVWLTSVPPSMNWDEVSHAYNAYSLLKTGRDQWSQVLPIFNFRAFGDYPTSLNLYLTVPAIALLGPNDVAARIPHVVMGVVIVVGGFMAGYWWRRNAYVGMITATLLAFEPWTLFTSRSVLQSNAAVMLISLGLALYLRARGSSSYIFKSIIFFGLSLFAYHNTRVFVPLLVLGLVLFSKKLQHRFKWILIAALAGAILIIPSSRARSKWVGIVDAGAVAYLEQARNLSSLSPAVSKFIYNRPVYWLGRVARNYVDYFSPEFLFLNGGTQYQFSVPNIGVSFPVNAIFFYIGIVAIVFNSPFIIWWLIIAPVAASITQDRFAVVRATTMIPVVQMVSAYGIWLVLSKLSTRGKNIFKIAYVTIFILLSVNYLYNYFNTYPIKYSQSWQFGYSQAVLYAKEHYQEYDQIIFTKRYGEAHEYVLWYWQWSPEKYQTDTSLKWDYHDGWYWIDAFDKFKFVNDWKMKQVVQNLEPNKKYLIIASPEETPRGTHLQTINFLDGKPALMILNK